MACKLTDRDVILSGRVTNDRPVTAKLCLSGRHLDYKPAAVVLLLSNKKEAQAHGMLVIHSAYEIYSVTVKNLFITCLD